MLSDRIIHIIEHQADRLEDQWAQMVRSHPATPSYHRLDDEELESSVREVYHNLGLYLESTHDAERLSELFLRIGRERRVQGIPLHELVFAIILVRRNLWNFIEEEGICLSTLEFHQMEHFLHRVMNFFDKTLYFVVVGYEEGEEERPPKKDLVSSLLHSFSLGILPEIERRG